MADSCSPVEGVSLSPSPHPSASAPAEAPAAVKTVLNVGCGYTLRQKLHPHFHGPEWREVRLDVDPAVHPDIICSITDMSPIATGLVDAIWSSHNLEHLQRHEVPAALAEFIRVLKPQGLLLLTLPDLRQVAQFIVDRVTAYMLKRGSIVATVPLMTHPVPASCANSTPLLEIVSARELGP